MAAMHDRERVIVINNKRLLHPKYIVGLILNLWNWI